MPNHNDLLVFVRQYERERFGRIENVTSHWRGLPGSALRRRAGIGLTASGATASRL